MISDLALCDLCVATYTTPAKWERNDFHATLTRQDDLWIVAFRGSASFDDWWADFQIIPHGLRKHPQIGLVESGMLDGVMQLAGAIQADLAGRQVVLTGHSRGAGEALILTALMVTAGTPPIRVTTFGSPRIGFVRMQELLHEIPGIDFRNGLDPVPAMPLPFQHPRRMVPLGAAPPGPWRPEDHRIANYRAALAAAAR